MRRFSILALVLLVGCSKGNFSHTTGGSREYFAYALSNKVTTLDPGRVQDIDMGDVLRNVFEGLVSYDEKNQIVPQLATGWKVTNGGRTYVFALRHGVKFHNGREMVAEDVRWTFERNLSAGVKSQVAKDYLEPIVGVDDFAAGKATSVSGIQVVDKYTVSLTIDKPRAYFLGDLTYPCAYILPKEAAGSEEMTKMEQAVGTGPFKFSRISEDQELDLVANPNYYGGVALVSKIVRPVILDPSTQLNKYRSGELDQMSIARQDVPSIQKDPDLKNQLKFEPRPALYYFYLNEKTYPPFANPKVRRAFAMAFNRPHLVNDLLPGYTEAKGILPPGMPGYRDQFQGIPYDPIGAKKLLAEAGYPDGSKMPPVDLAYREATPDARIASSAAATAIEANLGVKVQPHAYEWGTLLALRNKGKIGMGFMSWYADYLDPQNFLSMLLMSTAPQNTEGWSNPQFDALCAQADVDPDQSRRLKLYQQAEDIAVMDGAKLPIYFQRDAVLLSPRVQGLRTNLMGDLPHLKVKISH